jgi:isocitrate dehydrogenase (NAD+)
MTTRRTVTLLPGDGIGPEITEAVLAVLEAARAPVDFEPFSVGEAAQIKTGEALPPEVLASIRKNRVALKGPVTTPIGEGFTSVNVRLRQELELFANVRPVHNLPGVASRFESVDLVVLRENTEDLYSGLEHVVVPGVVEGLKIITEKASTRIARFAFDYARRHGRKKVTVVHKANIMKLADGLFLDCFRRVAREIPDVRAEEQIVDATCMRLVMFPERFDVLLLPNLYGDIVSDLCAGLVGGLGVVPSGNIGADIALFEAVHGSAPDIAGRNLANPTALLLSAIMMLHHMGEVEAADRTQQALLATFGEGIRTPDLGGTAGTREFARAVADRVGS